MNNCNIDEIFSGMETTFNRIFNTNYNNFTQVGKYVCQQSENNTLFVVLFAFIMPLLEAFFPFLPLTGIIIFNNNLLGPVFGSLISVLGSSLGAFILFYFARRYFQERFQNYIKRKNHTKLFDKISAGTEKHGVLYLIVMYGVFGLIVPSFIVTISLALTNLSKRLFAIGLLLGKLILVIQVSIFGEFLAQSFTNPKVLIPLCLIIIAFIIVKKVVEKKDKQ